MSRTKKFVALFMVFALAFSMLALGGCTTDEGTDTTDEGTERAAITSVDDLGEGRQGRRSVRYHR